jgi:hypothetical protein
MWLASEKKARIQQKNILHLSLGTKNSKDGGNM